jgi:hypothetical protein
MTADQFVELRCEELRRFFQGHFGIRWLRAIRVRIGWRTRLSFFKDHFRPSLDNLRPVEALAVAMGFKATRLNLPPFERKSRERLAEIVNCATRQVLVDGLVDESDLCSMAQHKLRARPLRNDVFPQSFLDNWCESTRT